MRCKKCDSENTKVTKHLYLGDKTAREEYHYMLSCLNCKARYYLPRSKEIFELVKNQQWTLSKNAQKKLGQQENIENRKLF